MGITLFDADMIVQEHRYKPLPPTVHLLGRQTIYFDYSAAKRLFTLHGLTAKDVSVEIDRTTLGAQNGSEPHITDTTFFRMLGVENVIAIDHSDYEGAELIVDLNQPLPKELEGSADFIFGGSVLDNVFDPAGYLRNVNRLLRAGGRLFDSNTYCFSRSAYALQSPAWYWNYCVLNRFSSCSVYVIEGGPHLCSEPYHVYGFDVDSETDLIPNLGTPPSGLLSGVIVLAEKGEDTTWDYIPSQDCYRGADEWQLYRDQVIRMKGLQRPFMQFSSPTAEQLAAYPMRNARCFRYLGCFDPAAKTMLDPARASALMDQSTPRGIRIIEATYGWSQRTTELKRTGLVPISRGNVTGILAFLLNGKDECDLEINASILGDPAPGLEKDLSVHYYDVGEPNPRVRHIYIPAEAHGKRLVIPKLKWKMFG